MQPMHSSSPKWVPDRRSTSDEEFSMSSQEVKRRGTSCRKRRLPARATRRWSTHGRSYFTDRSDRLTQFRSEGPSPCGPRQNRQAGEKERRRRGWFASGATWLGLGEERGWNWPRLTGGRNARKSRTHIRLYESEHFFILSPTVASVSHLGLEGIVPDGSGKIEEV